MPLVPVRVYLNEGPDNYFGFHNEFANEPRLRLAATFTLEINDSPTNTPPQRILGDIFEQLNIGGDLVPATTWTERYRAEKNRSLSVGDVVVLGEMAYTCESMGWNDLSTDEVIAAVGAFNEKGPHRVLA